MWPNPQFSVDLVTFTEEILNENFIFCAADIKSIWKFPWALCPFARVYLKKQTSNCADEVSFYMTDLYNITLVKPLCVIFKKCIKCGTIQKTITLLSYYQYLVKYLRSWYFNVSSTFYGITNFYLIINHILDQMILVLTSLYMF